MPPLKYRVECRDNFTERGAQRMSDLWNYTTVKRILRNRVYLGHTLLGKSRKVSVKSKKKVKVPEEEWVFTKNTHEALVSQEKFDLAAHFMGENTKANGANPAFRHSIFGGIAYCACCGADWQFERIRCAVCGDEATSELQYVHLEGDDKHRLHVCSACDSTVATVFGAESEDFDPDFESWRCAELMVAYAQTRGQAQKDASKAGNA